MQVFDEDRSKAKNLLKIKKAVVSCAPYDQRLKIKLPCTKKETHVSIGDKSDVLNQSNRYQDIFQNALSGISFDKYCFFIERDDKERHQ